MKLGPIKNSTLMIGNGQIVVTKPQTFRKSDLEAAINDELAAWKELNKAIPPELRVVPPIQTCFENHQEPYWPDVDSSAIKRRGWYDTEH